MSEVKSHAGVIAPFQEERFMSVEIRPRYAARKHFTPNFMYFLGYHIEVGILSRETMADREYEIGKTKTWGFKGALNKKGKIVHSCMLVSLDKEVLCTLPKENHKCQPSHKSCNARKIL